MSCELCGHSLWKRDVPYSSNKSRKILFSDKRFFSHFLCIACQVFTCATCCLTWFICAALFACRIEIFCPTVPLFYNHGGLWGLLVHLACWISCRIELKSCWTNSSQLVWAKPAFELHDSGYRHVLKKEVSECHASFVRL